MDTDIARDQAYDQGRRTAAAGRPADASIVDWMFRETGFHGEFMEDLREEYRRGHADLPAMQIVPGGTIVGSRS